MSTQNLKAWFVALLSVAAIGATAGVLYDNTTYDTGTVLGPFANGQTIGDEIFLSNNAKYPALTNFSFEYFSPDTSFFGTVSCEVQFFLNNGAPTNGFNAPGTIFYDSGAFPIQAPNSIYPGTNSAVLNFSLANLQGGVHPLSPSFLMPSNFTVAITFTYSSGFDAVGLNVFDPATVGTNYGDYWLNNGGTWELLTNANMPVAFAMQLNATPEPSVLAIGAVGAAVVAGFARRRRKN